MTLARAAGRAKQSAARRGRPGDGIRRRGPAAGAMSPVRRRSLAMLKRCVLRAFRRVPVSVFLYGSVGRGEFRPASDIDVAVLPRGRWDRAALEALREQVEELPIPYKVDLINLREVGWRLRAVVLREGVVWKR